MGGIFVNKYLRIPHFDGVFNEVKAKTMIILYADYCCHRYKGLTLADIALCTGCNYSTLKRSLGKWSRWGLINYSDENQYGYQPSRRRYHILIRGRSWILRWHSLMPLGRYISDIFAAINHASTDSAKDFTLVRIAIEKIFRVKIIR